MEIVAEFVRDIAAGPAWVAAWVAFMGAVFMLAIPFAFSRVEARWTLVAMAFTFPSMIALYSIVGYVRLLGLIHVIFWTPLAIYLWRRRGEWGSREHLADKWILLLFATILLSLAFDYSDLIRYLLGDRS